MGRSRIGAAPGAVIATALLLALLSCNPFNLRGYLEEIVEESKTPAPINPPTNVTVSSGDAQLTLSWDAVSGADTYNIYWDSESGVTTANTGFAGLTSPFEHTSLTYGDTYYYIVTAKNADGESLPSDEVYGTPYEPGSSWTERTVKRQGGLSWNSITISSDGNKLAAAAYGGFIYTSTDTGYTWTEQANAGNRTWNPIAGSNDGTKLAVAAHGGSIFTSSDGGSTWIARTGAGSYKWRSITSSSDGDKLAACAENQFIYTSIDGGETWTERTNAGTRDWVYITGSSDGINLAAATAAG